MNRSIIFSALTIIFGFGIAFQAFGAMYWPSELGYLSASPGTVVLLAVAIASVPFLKGSAISLGAWALLAWGLVVSVVSIGLFGLNDLYAEKTFSHLLLYTAWISPLLCIGLIDRAVIKRATLFAIIVTIMGYIVSDLLPESLPEFVRGLIFGQGLNTYFDSRPRAFMSEPSHLANILSRYAIIYFLVSEYGKSFSAKRVLIAMGLLGGALLVTGGKGAILSLALSLIALTARRKHLPLMVFAVPVAGLFASTQLDAFATDLERFTSISTRSTLFLSGLLATITNPFGFGFYGLYGALDSYSVWIIERMDSLNLNFSEVYAIVENDENVSFKSTLFDFSVVFGLPFLVLVVGIMRRINLRDPRALFALFYFLMSGLSTSGTESISLFLGLAVLMKFYPSRSAASVNVQDRPLFRARERVR